MVLRFWESIEFYCMNHEKPVKMRQETTVSNTLYRCYLGFPESDDNPNGYKPGEPVCKNILATETAIRIKEKLETVYETMIRQNVIPQLKNYRCKVMGVSVLVLSDSRGRLKIGVLNRRGMGNV